ncbi:hypothetical protein [Sphingomonas sp. NIBR02145]|uniref:hypothetical protein n=1 Tax=Sphingomonas sp. NIBR02145 TaxID=3014784 RepID=UPI0022B55447|nr:hypothetical protein [Sphingomonas sp. NIBR02145]WHU00814.1 hypothetical protein O3305_11330 [Sphingomonas sp. NIBR02145]
MKLRHAVPTLVLLTATACTPVQMRLPVTSPERTEQAVLEGIGDNHDGEFILAEYGGSFVRGAGYRWFGNGIGEAVQLDGGAAFIVRGGEIRGELSAECRSSATDVGTGAITIRTRGMAYRCRYARDREPIAAQLVLNERGALMREERRGHIDMEGVRIDLRSEHRLAGSGLPMAMPLGYVFSISGDVIGGVDLNGRSKRVLLPRDPALREAVVAAALSLALFIDAEIGEMSE